MDRGTQLHELVLTLEDPGRALLRAILLCQRQGRLDVAARTMSQAVERDATLLWAAVLVAISSAELRLAGSVAFSTPDASPFTFAVGHFGVFRATTHPSGETADLGLGVPYLGYMTLAARSQAPGLLTGHPLWEAVSVLGAELGSHLPHRVRVVRLFP